MFLVCIKFDGWHRRLASGRLHADERRERRCEEKKEASAGMISEGLDCLPI
jgi:hypothetical protein